MRKNATTIILPDYGFLDSEYIEANQFDDVIVCLGESQTVKNIHIVDRTGSLLAHRDAIQLIPKDGRKPNSQFMGALAVDITIDNCVIESDGKLQGIFASDGLFKRLTVTNNKINTKSQHEITIAGVLSGDFSNNDAVIVLEPLRIGGNLPEAFTVGSFKGSISYQFVKGQEYVEDYRDMGDVLDFDIVNWYNCHLETKYLSFVQHFTDTLTLFKKVTAPATSLSQVIASHEGDYFEYNRGRAGDAKGRHFPTTTVGGLIHLGELPYRNPHRVHAVGKYQFITQTLKDAVRAGVLDKNEYLTREAQERVFEEFLIKKKRRDIAKYITGEGSLNNAITAIAKEWASCPSLNGASYYARNGNDKAHTSLEDIKRALYRARRIYKSTGELGLY